MCRCSIAWHAAPIEHHFGTVLTLRVSPRSLAGFSEGPGADEASIERYLQALALAIETGQAADPAIRQQVGRKITHARGLAWPVWPGFVSGVF